MSAEHVKEIIEKAVTDEAYRELLFSNPDKALEGYELSGEEASTLRAIERDEFDAILAELGDRVSRGSFSIFNFISRQSLGGIKDVGGDVALSDCVGPREMC